MPKCVETCGLQRKPCSPENQRFSWHCCPSSQLWNSMLSGQRSHLTCPVLSGHLNSTRRLFLRNCSTRPLSNIHLRSILSTLTAPSGSGNGSPQTCGRQAFFRRCYTSSIRGDNFVTALAQATRTRIGSDWGEVGVQQSCHWK